MYNEVNLYFFNVNSGDSTLIEFIGNTTHYMLIDTNTIKKDGKSVIPAYEFLKSKNVGTIDTLIITHLHSDHYSGISDIIEHFKIEQLIVPPIFTKNKEIAKETMQKFVDFIGKDLKNTTNEECASRKYDLAYFVKFLYNNWDTPKIFEGRGYSTDLLMMNIDINSKIYMPIPKIKGWIQHVYTDSDNPKFFYNDFNESSIVFNLELFGHNFLFSGDNTPEQFSEHESFFYSRRKTCLDINHLKIPHHGSKNNCTEKMYEYIFKRDKNTKYGFISAAGNNHHPSEEVYEHLTKYNVLPRCTNLSNYCRNERNILGFKKKCDDNPEISRFLASRTLPSPTPCQGNITVNIKKDGTLNVSSEKGFYCPFDI